MTTKIASPTLAGLRVGRPDVAGPLAVFPIFGPEPRLTYRGFATAQALGAAVHELPGGASVNDLVVHNPTDLPVLLLEGEEVLGAQQNRTFDASILVAAGAKLNVPVSCVEHGRWDGRRHHEAFTPAPQAAHPSLRRMKSAQASQRVAAGETPRADQGAVWAHIDEVQTRHAVHSPTGALDDIHTGHRDRLDTITGAIELHDGQLGALAALGGRFEVLDLVSRPDVFGTLHGPLVHGYALDALDAVPAPVPDRSDATEVLNAIALEHAIRRDAIGLGQDVRFQNAAVAGSALTYDDELIQASAFFTLAGPAAAARIRRPSRRR